MNFLSHKVVAEIVSSVLLAGLFLVVLTPSPASAAVGCASSYNNKTIGLEFVSTSCRTDTTSTRIYLDTAVNCSSGQVAKYADYGDTSSTPGSLVGSLLSQGYRVFGDQYGNHIIAVHSNFGGSTVDKIDGKQMSNYPAGQFHSNVFDKILYPQSAPVDADNDHYTQCGGKDCNDGNPDVFPGAPEICSDGVANDCSNPQLTDCANPACSEDQACLPPAVDIPPGDHPRDCHLNVAN